MCKYVPMLNTFGPPFFFPFPPNPMNILDTSANVDKIKNAGPML